MAKRYYHNVTQEKFNETEVIDLVEEMNDGDVILWSEAGNACVSILTEMELKELQKQVDDYYA